ncbi:MAG: DUF262 domain-containing protein [Planctomycetaceae bacterium]|nr:DUF262 domain-containing protein [Planctomycetaceae bacterium]
MDQLVFKTLSVRQIQRRLEDRVFAIPRLQREFVWNGRKAAEFLDSIYRGMPIGSILVWQTGKKNGDLLRPSLHILPPFSPQNKEIWYLVDGQQRLSVLYQSVRGERKENSTGQVVDFGRLSFRLDNGDGDDLVSWFSYRKPVEGQFVSVADILSSNWQRRLRGLSVAKMRRVKTCRDRLLGYPVPLITMSSSDIDRVRDAFIRINSRGMRISSADRAFARASAIDLREKANDLRAHLSDEFHDLDYQTILLAFTFVTPGREPDVGERALEAAVRWWEKRIKADDVQKKRFLSLWAESRRAFLKALDYLHTTFDVLEKDFLPSVNMLATLTVFFFHHRAQPNRRQRDEIRKWFWATGVGQRYSGRGYRQNIIADVGFFKKLAGKTITRFKFPDLVDRSDLLRTEYTQPAAIAKAFFCLLARRKPCFLNNGEPVPLRREIAMANRSEKHHIFPRALLAQYGFRHREYNSLCNICFVVAEENQSIGSRSPRSYLADFKSRRFFTRAMKSHLIPCDKGSGLWTPGVARAYRQFRKRRLQMICKAFEDEAGIRLFRRNE